MLAKQRPLSFNEEVRDKSVSLLKQENDHQKKQKYQNKNDHDGGKSAVTAFWDSTLPMFILFILISSGGCMIIMIIIGNIFIYHIALCMYEIIILCHYGIPLISSLTYISINDDNDNKDNNNEDVHNDNTNSCESIPIKYWSLMKHYWFQWQIIFCFGFNIISSILLFIYIGNKRNYTINYLFEALSYLFGAFSIPLPLICLRMYPKETKLEMLSEPLNGKKMSFVGSVTSYKSLRSPASDATLVSVTYQSSVSLIQKHKFKPWKEEGIVCCTMVLYIIHATCFILIPVLESQDFTNSMNAMYDNNIPEAVYLINQFFLRSFVVMLLIKTIFSLMINLVDAQYSFNEKKWKRFKMLFLNANTDGVCECNYYTLFKTMVMSFIIIASMAMDSIQLISREKINIFSMKISIDFSGDDHLCHIMNILWTIIHGVGIFMCFVATNNFHAIKKKANNNEEDQKWVQSLTISKVSFITECLILIASYLMDVTFLHKYNEQMWNVYRQISILVFVSFEASSILYLISIQDLCKKSFAKKNWRTKLVSCYFQFVIIVNAYDFIYLSIFKITYYHQYELTESYTRLSYAFSFAALRIFILFATKLFKLYGKYHWAQKYYQQQGQEVENQDNDGCQLNEENLGKHNEAGGSVLISEASVIDSPITINNKKPRAHSDWALHQKSNFLQEHQHLQEIKSIDDNE